MSYKDTVDDFNLKWSNSFVYLDNKVVFIQGAYYPEKEKGEVSDNLFVQIITPENVKEKKFDFDLDSPVPILLPAQFFNSVELPSPSAIAKLQTACLLYSRNPRRQNKRSICTENSVITSPLFGLIQQLIRKWPEVYMVTRAYVESLLANKYPTFTQALEYCHLHGCVAVSPEFAVSLSVLTGNKYLFLSKFGFIGEADTSNIYVRHKASLQEVNDFVHRSNLDLRVIDAG